jgi:hypothetical protein
MQDTLHLLDLLIALSELLILAQKLLNTRNKTQLLLRLEALILVQKHLKLVLEPLYERF